jgi:hypothetical protein
MLDVAETLRQPKGRDGPKKEIYRKVSKNYRLKII